MEGFLCLPVNLTGKCVSALIITTVAIPTVSPATLPVYVCYVSHVNCSSIVDVIGFVDAVDVIEAVMVVEVRVRWAVFPPNDYLSSRRFPPLTGPPSERDR